MPINTNLPQFNGDFPCLTAQYPDSILHQFAFKMTTAAGYLTKNQDNFLRTGPFLMSSSGNESYGHAGSYVFDRTKKYWFFEKLQPKTFCDIFFITRFSKNIFSKNNFEKSNISNSKFQFSPKTDPFPVPFVSRTGSPNNQRCSPHLGDRNLNFKLLVQKTLILCMRYARWGWIRIRGTLEDSNVKHPTRGNSILPNLSKCCFLKFVIFLYFYLKNCDCWKKWP